MNPTARVVIPRRGGCQKWCGSNAAAGVWTFSDFLSPIFSCHAASSVVGLTRNLDRGAVFFHESTAETSFEGPLEPDAVRTAVGSRE